MTHELVLGANRATEREYVVLRLEDDDGREAHAIGYSRGTPLLEATRSIVTAIDPGIGLSPQAVMSDLRGRFSQPWPSMIRAASLVDIALWKLQAEAANEELGSRWGAQPESPLRVMAVAGYFAAARPLDDLRREVRQFCAEGAGIVKVMVPGRDRREDLTLVAELAEDLDHGVMLAVDAHGSCVSVDDAVSLAEALLDLGVEFLEDPFPGHPISALGALAARVPLRLAIGEDLPDDSNLSELVDIADYFRIDATSSGGYTFALRALDEVERREKQAFPHVFPAIHTPLARYSPTLTTIEAIPDYVGADPYQPLLRDNAPEDPLTGPRELQFDPDALERAAAQSWTCSFPSGGGAA